MFGVIRNILLYAGFDRANYERVKPKVRSVNRTMTIVLSAMAALLIGLMFISSFKSASIRSNQTVYLLGLIMSIFVLFCSVVFSGKHPKLIFPLVYVAYSIYYMYGILIGAVTDPNGKTVTFMVMLVFMPTLFIDMPIHVFGVTFFYDVIFIILCLMHKTGNVLSVDLMDAIIFGILGIGSGFVINRMKIRGYISEQNLTEISRIDQLTQLNNQNAYKFDKYSVPELCQHSLACLYIDVNGLHELNNEKGHDFGDTMLQFVANEIRERFGEDYTYRIGGDEFVAFVLDVEIADLSRDVRELKQAVEREGYHIATGYEVMSTRRRTDVDRLNKLTKDAETRMREDKDAFYERTNSERRMRKN